MLKLTDNRVFLTAAEAAARQSETTAKTREESAAATKATATRFAATKATAARFVRIGVSPWDAAVWRANDGATVLQQGSHLSLIHI